jgi:uncharacterized protein (TIGR03067 family)
MRIWFSAHLRSRDPDNGDEGDHAMSSRVLFAPVLALVCACAALSPTSADEKNHPAKKDLELLKGTWSFATVVNDGEKQQPTKRGEEPLTITFAGERLEIKRGDRFVQSGTLRLDPSKDPKAIDLTIAEGEGKGTVQLGIYELKGLTFRTCIDPRGKNRPKEFEAPKDSGFVLTVVQREFKAGPDPLDASIVYDVPHRMNSGFTAYNGRAFDQCALSVDPKLKIVLPDKATVVERHDRAGVLLVFMEKRASIRAHFPRPVSIAEYRRTMGCAVKLENGELLIGTFGEFGFLEGATQMKLLVLVPPKVEVEQRAGLIGGYGGRAGTERPANAINPTREDKKPSLTQSKEGTPPRWVSPTDEDGWHEIPSVPDVDWRASKSEKKQ